MEISELKLDATFVAFEMHGAREIIKLTAGAVHIEKQVMALENAIVDNPGLAVDLIKSLIETACITILKDKGYDEPQINKLDKLPKLFRHTLQQLQLMPDNYAVKTKVDEGLRNTAQGLCNAVQGICEIRNSEGFASHGKDAYTAKHQVYLKITFAFTGSSLMELMLSIKRQKELYITKFI